MSACEVVHVIASKPLPMFIMRPRAPCGLWLEVAGDNVSRDVSVVAIGSKGLQAIGTYVMICYFTSFSLSVSP